MAANVDELLLLERVFLRIGSAESDEQLQNAVNKFLPAVLLKLSSPQEGVRKKVMELLVHINKRLKSRPLVQLPVDSLLVQYQDPAASAFIINFTIIYIKLGYPRLANDKKAELVPMLLSALDGKPLQHRDSLFLLIMPVLGNVKIPSDKAVVEKMFRFGEKPLLAKQFADFMLDMLLLPYGTTLPLPEEPGDNAAQSNLPPGLCEYALKRLIGEAPMKPEDLEETKLGIVKFLASGVYPDSDVLCHLVVASADSRFSVANSADFELRKITGSLDWSNVSMMQPLFSLYLGTPASKPNQPNAVKPELKRAAAGTRLRLKLLPCLVRAKGQAVNFPLCIQVFFDSLFSQNTNTRLRGLALNFCLTVIRNVNPSLLSHVAHVLLSGLLKLLAEGEPSLKGQTYNVIGHLAIFFPGLVNKDLLLLTNFLESLGKEEGQDLRLNIREALLTMVDAFRPESANSTAHVPPCKAATNGSATANTASLSKDSASSPSVLPPELLQLQMQELLTRQIENPEPMVRFVVVRYAAVAFPPDHAPSRFLLLLASADSKEEVSSEAISSLFKVEEKPFSGKKLSKEDLDKELVLPAYPDMVKYIWEQTQVSRSGGKSPFSPDAFVQIVKYLRLCLARSAGVFVPTNETLTHPSEFTPNIGRYLKEIVDTKAETIDHYLEIVHKLLSTAASSLPLLALLEIVGCIPQVLAPKFVDKLPVFKDLLHHTSEEIRDLAAQIFGILSAHGLKIESDFDRCLSELVHDTSNKKTLLEQQHGQLLAMAHAIERSIVIYRTSGTKDSATLKKWPTYKTVILTIYSFLENSSPILVGGACSALGLLARCAELPLTSGKGSDEKEPGKLDILLKLQSIMNNSKIPAKVKERAVKAIGHMCVGESFPHTKEVIEGFLAMAKESKDVEVHLSIGEALVCCVLGPSSPVCRDPWTVLESEFKPSGNVAEGDFQWLFDKLLKNMVKEPHPNQKQACCLWLLALLKNCSKSKDISSRLPEIQAAFMEFLGENNDIVQDAASKGLALVYESTGPEHRDKLVSELLDTLMSGRRAVRQVTADTEIFAEGEVGKAPGGGNLSTYKELCSLASDLNQPDLIYKFMHLANHNAVWNSKKGAAFGFSSIAASAGDQLSAHLPKIVPRLYRYQFDPTPKIQNSMSSIWHTLVPETSKTVDKYHKEILEDLIQNLTSNQWRVRQSCCLAVADFIRGSSKRSIMDDLESLPNLWLALFRVMDDVHDGTRQAAGNTTRILSKICIRASDTNQGKSGQEMVKTILPVLLETGICNNVSEVRSISLQAVSQLVNVAGAQLKPHLPVLLPALLEATGELESANLAYLSTRYGADADKQEMIDSVRAAVAKSHYSTETMTKCLQYVDSEILEKVIPRISEMLRTSIGLGTKVATTHLIVLLSGTMKIELQPYAGKLLGVLVNGLLDRNGTVRKCYATAIGHIVSSAKESSLEKLFAKLQDWYFQKEDENVRSAIGLTFRAVAQHNQDILINYMDKVVPLTFFAMHKKKTPETTAAVEVWEDVWSEATPGTESALRMHMGPVCSLLKESLESQSWTIKEQAANAIGTLATKMGATLQANQRAELIEILLLGLSGRTWQGKESLLQALASLSTSCREALMLPENAQVVESIVNAVLKECRKEQPDYKLKALPALATILHALEVDRFSDFYSIVKEYFSEQKVEEEDEETEKESNNADTAAENSAKREEWMQFREVSFEALGKAWPTVPKTQAEFQWEVLHASMTCLKDSTRQVQGAVVGALSSFVDRLSVLDPSSPVSKNESVALELSKIVGELEKALHFSLGIARNTRIRKESLNILLTLAKKLESCGHKDLNTRLASSFSGTLVQLSKDHTPEVKSRVIDLREFLKKYEPEA
ncbi:proteasome adapter and scaffold protein ECM29 [Thrips palmi]|uniref:Proteasome adapter and scaffold protein ECM29 n=1 Tax=Thrips palmi TaxID=161013 RepID=A0A6P9A8B3_THRPL|nr:proteasome adapter and scaffold protein ECM29 [Thrips palmi]